MQFGGTMHFVLKRKKHSKRKYKDLLYNSPNRKSKSKSEYNREIKVQIEIGKSKLVEKKKSFLRPRCEIAVKNAVGSFCK